MARLEGSSGSHEKAVQRLVDKGAEVSAQGGLYDALRVASSGGHEKVFQRLLDKGAEANAQGGLYDALQAASSRGHEKVVQLLLDKGAEVNAQGGLYDNALQAASFGGHEKVVQLLLDKGAEVNAQGGDYGNALQAASSEGHEKVVQLLLDKGAEVNAQGGLYGNALQAASSEGHEKVVQLLLDKGAEVNAQGGLYDNALRSASSGGHEKVVQLLLDKGAEVNAQGGLYGNALQAASSGGHEKVVQLLLDKGAEVYAQGELYGDALQAAYFSSWSPRYDIEFDKPIQAPNLPQLKLRKAETVYHASGQRRALSAGKSLKPGLNLRDVLKPSKAVFSQPVRNPGLKAPGLWRNPNIVPHIQLPRWHLQLYPNHQRLFHPFEDTPNLGSRVDSPLDIDSFAICGDLEPPDYSANAEVLQVEHEGHTALLYFESHMITSGLARVYDVRLLVAERFGVDHNDVNLWWDGIYLDEDWLRVKDIDPTFDPVGWKAAGRMLRTSEARPSNWYGLHLAMQQIGSESVRSFLDRAGNLEVIENTTDGWTPLLLGARICRNKSLARRFRGSVHVPGTSARAQEDLSQCYRTMKFLLERGANPNASRAGRDPLLEVAEGGDKNCFILLLAYGADVSKTEALCRGANLPDETREKIKAWLVPWRDRGPIHDLPNLEALLRELDTDAQDIVSHTVAMDWEVPVIVERIQKLNPDKSAYDCLRDEVVLMACDRMNPTGTVTKVFEAISCGEFVKREWGFEGQAMLRDISQCCPLTPLSDGKGQ